MRALSLLGLAPALGADALTVGPRAVSPTELTSIGFEEYAQLHERSYAPGSPEYVRRKRLFDRRAAEVAEQNSNPDRTWTATINHLTDRTEEELDRLRGYSGEARPRERRSQHVQLLAEASRSFSLSDLPTEFSWKNLRASNKIMDQQECGSCWALSAATVIRQHSEIYLNQDRSCSVEQIISCTPNPAKCGGTGGCAGATTELAMEYILQNGCRNSSDWPYVGHSQECPAEHRPKEGNQVWTGLGSLLGSNADRSSAAGLGSAAFGMTGYRKLPENRVAPLLQAVYEQGPVAVTVAAGSAWNMYHSGVMNSCHRDAVISHAVTLLGFGEAKTGRRGRLHLYWLIQNSWGKRWGEQGTMRLQRRSHEEEEKWCGWDRNPGAGSGCQGGPSKVWVCGSCGILYDNVVPLFQQRDSSLAGEARARQGKPMHVGRVEVGPGEVR